MVKDYVMYLLKMIKTRKELYKIQPFVFIILKTFFPIIIIECAWFLTLLNMQFTEEMGANVDKKF